MPYKGVVITEVRTEVILEEPVVILAYRLPDEMVGKSINKEKEAQGVLANDDPEYGGHEHQIAVHTIYSRMELYGEDKYDAIESIIAENLYPSNAEGNAWPSPQERAALKNLHKIKLAGAARQAIRDLIEDPDEETRKHHALILASVLSDERVLKMRGSGWRSDEKRFRDWKRLGRPASLDFDGRFIHSYANDHENTMRFKPKHIKGQRKNLDQ